MVIQLDIKSEAAMAPAYDIIANEVNASGVPALGEQARFEQSASPEDCRMVYLEAQSRNLPYAKTLGAAELGPACFVRRPQVAFRAIIREGDGSQWVEVEAGPCHTDRRVSNVFAASMGGARLSLDVRAACPAGRWCPSESTGLRARDRQRSRVLVYRWRRGEGILL